MPATPSTDAPSPATPGPAAPTAALLTLGCARNEVDSDELAGRLIADGWRLTDQDGAADVVVVNTCGFVTKAKQESIDMILAAAARAEHTGAKVVATGCLAQRYGRELADSLPEAHAVLGFDHYPAIATTLRAVLTGERIDAHEPGDRRRLLPITPVDRAQAGPVPPGHLPAHLRGTLRHRLDRGPVAAVKLASGCDRRCTFCAIPSFRGAFVSRTPDEVLAEADALARDGVREIVLVSENSTSYGKDLGDPRALERLLPEFAAVPGLVRVRVSYLQPAEVRPGLIEAIAGTPGVAGYFDLSFQHASEAVLRRMRRFGCTERFLELLGAVRGADPLAGVRSNVIVGFPGETRADVTELGRFLAAARLDAIGVFDYSDEDGTEAAGLPGKVRADAIARRYARISELAEELCNQRAAERVGELVDVLVESVGRTRAEGRAAHQAPEVDGSTSLVLPGDPAGDRVASGDLVPAVGDLVRARVTGCVGVDLVAVPVAILDRAAS
jgi:ribosomal protein S12 methylthiotransferase